MPRYCPRKIIFFKHNSDLQRMHRRSEYRQQSSVLPALYTYRSCIYQGGQRHSRHTVSASVIGVESIWHIMAIFTYTFCAKGDRTRCPNTLIPIYECRSSRADLRRVERFSYNFLGSHYSVLLCLCFYSQRYVRFQPDGSGR